MFSSIASPGLTTQRSSNIFTVGEDALLICSSDLSVTLTEWLHNFQVVTSSASSESQLAFNPVNDSIHGNEYTCRITSPYGIQEQAIQLVVQSKLNYAATINCWGKKQHYCECLFTLVPLNEVIVSTTTDGLPIVGQQYRISCTILVPEGITNPIAVQWYGSGERLSNTSDITIGEPLTTSQANITSNLVLDPFRTSHGGQFSCRATILSQTPPFNISKTADIDIVIGCELTVDIFLL